MSKANKLRLRHNPRTGDLFMELNGVEVEAVLSYRIEGEMDGVPTLTMQCALEELDVDSSEAVH